MFTNSNQGWIGLDIGASSVKLAQVVRQGGELRLEEAAIVVRQDDWFTDSQGEAVPRSSADEVEAALASAPETAGRVAAATLPTTACEFNSAAVGSGDESPMNAISEEFASLGIDLGGRVFDYWPGLPTGRGAKSKPSSINILSTSCEWSDRLSADLASAGLDCRAIDGLPLALARVVGEVERANSQTPVAAIDWGYSGATFVLIDGGQPVYVRQLKGTPFRDVVVRVAGQLNLDEDEAGELLRSTGTLSSRSNGSSGEETVASVVAELIEPGIVALTEELDRTLHYLKSLGGRLLPKKVYLFGGGATIKNVDACLTRRLQREVVVWRLDAASEEIAASKSLSTCLLGPAIALSALRWEKAT